MRYSESYDWSRRMMSQDVDMKMTNINIMRKWNIERQWTMIINENNDIIMMILLI